VEGIRWIRLHYAYPRDFPDELVEVIAGEPRIVKYLDMPLQHASDRLLRSMKRGKPSRFLRELLARLRERVPGIALRTALIVGLPGETEEDFAELLDFVRAQRFERLGVFEYSREEGTAAAAMPGQVPARVRRARFEQVMEIQNGIAREQQRALVGRRLEVLVEGRSEETEHLLVGRHAQQAPEIDGLTYLNEGTAFPGEIVGVEVVDAHDYDLVGRVVARDARRGVRRLPARKTPATAPPTGGKRSGLRVLR
jgi:ribosomal protein S12 methylthiotransferase